MCVLYKVTLQMLLCSINPEGNLQVALHSSPLSIYLRDYFSRFLQALFKIYFISWCIAIINRHLVYG